MFPNRQSEITSPRNRWLLAIFLVLLVVAGGMWLWHAGFLQELFHEDRLVAALRDEGSKGPLLCIAAQFVQVVIFPIPGEITQVAAGYVFGFWRGFLYSVIGIMAGSAFNFYFARTVGRPTLERFISSQTLDRVDRSLNSGKGKSTIFLLFLLPGAPKDAMCYGAGLTTIGLTEFVVISGLARSPALFASILSGAHAGRGDYRSLVLTGLVIVFVIASYYLYERYRGRSQQKL